MNVSRGIGFIYGAIAFAALLVAGCSGGGGSSVSPNAPTTAVPAPKSTAFRQSATAILTFPRATPSPGNKRYYVSPSSSSVSVTIVSVNGLPPPTWVPQQVVIPLAFSGSGQNCNVTGGVATCAVTIPAPPGNVIYSIGTYFVPSPLPSQSPSAPVILDYGQGPVQIAEGKANTVSLTLQGVPKTATLSLPTPLIPDMTSTETMVLTVLDASGMQITGSKAFDSGFKFTDSDGTSIVRGTALVVNGQPPSKTIQVSSPLDVVQITYGGLAIGQQTIAASGVGKAGRVDGTSLFAPLLYPIVIPGSFVDDAAHGGQPSDPNYNQNTILIPLGSSPVTVTPSERGRTDFKYSNCVGPPNTVTCLALGDLAQVYPPCNDGNQVAIFSPGPPGQTNGYTYTITPGTTPGLCLQQFVDGLTPQHSGPPVGNPLVNGEIWVQVK